MVVTCGGTINVELLRRVNSHPPGFLSDGLALIDRCDPKSWIRCKGNSENCWGDHCEYLQCSESMPEACWKGTRTKPEASRIEHGQSQQPGISRTEHPTSAQYNTGYFANSLEVWEFLYIFIIEIWSKKAKVINFQKKRVKKKVNFN